MFEIDVLWREPFAWLYSTELCPVKFHGGGGKLLVLLIANGIGHVDIDDDIGGHEMSPD